MFVTRSGRSCWPGRRASCLRALAAVPDIYAASNFHNSEYAPSSSSPPPPTSWTHLNPEPSQSFIWPGTPSSYERSIRWPAGFAHYASIHTSRDSEGAEPIQNDAEGMADRLVDQAHNFSESAYSLSDTLGTAVLSTSDAVSNASEVAALAADHWLPTALLQQLLENVHIYTGWPWWIAIAATTFSIRTLLVPVSLYQMGAIARLAIVKPEIERLTKRMKESGYAPLVVERCQNEVAALMKKHRTSPFTPLYGALIQAPLFVFFFFAIQGMAKGVDSFQTGGAYWFTDLTTADPTYALPALTALTFLLSIELNAADGMAGQPQGGQQKMILRLLGLGMVPLTMAFPKALFCYWLTANVFSLGQATAFKSKWLKTRMGVPDVPPAPPPPASKGLWNFGGTPSEQTPVTYARPQRRVGPPSLRGANRKQRGRKTGAQRD